MRVTIVANQKGGVGKTTLTREIGLALSERGYRVLLVDSDPQGNLTKSLVDGEPEGLYDAFEGARVSPVAVRPSLFLLAGDSRLSALERRYLGEVDAYERLSAVIARLCGEMSRDGDIYDVVMIDAPPSLGVMTLNGLAAADSLVVPVRPALYSLQGTNDLLQSVAKVRKSLNPRLDLLGVVVNDYLSGPVIARQIRDEIEAAFGGLVFSTVVSRTVKIEEAIARKEGVTEREAASKVARDIDALTDEFLMRLGLAVRATSAECASRTSAQ